MVAVTAFHALTMTSPVDTRYENTPLAWNSAHLLTAQLQSADFSNSNGVTFGVNAGTVTASIQTSYRASTDAIGLNTAGSNITWTANSSGLSIDGRGYAGTGTSGTNATFTLNSAGLAISVGPGATTFVGTNTAQTNVSWTVNTSGISLNAAGYAGTGTSATNASVTLNSAGLAVSVNAGATTFVGTNTAQTNVTWTVNTSGISFNAGGYAGTTTAATNATVTLNSLGFQISVPNAGAATNALGLNTAQTNVTWTANTAGVSLNAAGYAGTTTAMTNVTATLNSLGLQLSVAAPGGAPGTYSYFVYPDDFGGLAQHPIPNQSTFSLWPVIVPYYVSASYVRLIMYMAQNSTTLGTTANTSIVGDRLTSFSLLVYSLGTGANSRSLQYVTSGSASFNCEFIVSAGNTGSFYTVTYNVSYPVTGSANAAFQQVVPLSNSSIQISSTGLTDFTGTRYLDIPFPALLSPGPYWFALGGATNASTTGGIAGITNAGFAPNSIGGIVQVNSQFNVLGTAAANSNALQVGLGSFSQGQLATTASIALSLLTSRTNQPLINMEIIRQA